MANAVKSFSVSEGRTYVLRGHEKEYLADFELRLLAKLVNRGVGSEGFWLAELKTTERQGVVSKQVVVPSSAFDSSSKLVSHLRSVYCGGTFHFSVGRLSLQYYEQLKNDFNQRYRVMDIVEAIGQQRDGEWVFSQRAQVYNGAITESVKYQIVNEEVNCMALTYFTELTNGDLRGALSKVISAARDAFRGNYQSFLLAMGYACFSMLKKEFAEGMMMNEGHPIGLMHSVDMNVRKTLALTSLAMLTGVNDPRAHPSVCIGISAELLTSKLARTKCVVFVDDGGLSDKLFNELIVAVSGGFTQDSTTGGMLRTRGSLLFTSNTLPTDSRVIGRITPMAFKQTGDVTAEQRNALRRFRRACGDAVGALNTFCVTVVDPTLDFESGLLDELHDYAHQQMPHMQRMQVYGIVSSAYMAAQISSFVDYATNVGEFCKRIISECAGSSEMNKFFDACTMKVKAEPDMVSHQNP